MHTKFKENYDGTVLRAFLLKSLINSKQRQTKKIFNQRVVIENCKIMFKEQIFLDAQSFNSFQYSSELYNAELNSHLKLLRIKSTTQ